MFLPLHVGGGACSSLLYIFCSVFCHGSNPLLPQTHPKPACFSAPFESVAVLAWSMSTDLPGYTYTWPQFNNL